MTDTRLVEGFLTNPKIDGLSDAAFRTYINGLVYAVSAGTDGYLPGRALRLLHPDGARPDTSLELVKRRLWEPATDGWRIHDFDKHQTSAEQIERSRELARARKQRERDKKTEEAMSRATGRVTGRVTAAATPKDSDRTVDSDRTTKAADNGTTDGQGADPRAVA